MRDAVFVLMVLAAAIVVTVNPWLPLFVFDSALMIIACPQFNALGSCGEWTSDAILTRMYSATILLYVGVMVHRFLKRRKAK